MKFSVIGAFAMLTATIGVASAGPAVKESARRIPVAYNVDVVVVGGTTQAVEAATAAARAGAKVFLAAPRNYLGEDLCSGLRLWLEPGVTPTTDLGRRLFEAPVSAAVTPEAASPVVRRGLAFTYTTDRTASGAHADTAKHTMLRDGQCGSAQKQSVQYDGNVTITCDLGKYRKFGKVTLLAYQREKDFVVKDLAIAVSDDGKAWTEPVSVANPTGGAGGFENKPVAISPAVTGGARHLRLSVRKADNASRMLLAEIVIEPADAKDEPPAAPPAKAKAAKPAAPAPAPQAAPRLTTPMQIKTALDDAMLAAKVQFLYGCYPTDVLRDANGKVAGIVMANRAGRQAVLAKVVIDATDRANVARLAGAKFRPYPAGKQTFRQVVIGGEPKTTPNLKARVIGDGYPLVNISRGGHLGKATGKIASVIEYTMDLPMADGSFASFAAADQAARDLTWTPETLRVSETLFQVPPDAVVSGSAITGDWPGDDKVDLCAFAADGVERLFVLGGCADVPRDVAAELLQPTGLMGIAQRIGQTAAKMAASLPAPRDVKLPGGAVTAAADGEVREVLAGVRPTQKLETIASQARPLPVLARYDVVVVGGGTGGAPAAIASARKGAKTLVIEYQAGLGGVSTLGLIGRYYHGYRGGFTAEIDKGVAALGGGKRRGGSVEWKMEYYRREIRKAKGDIWFGSVGCGALVDNGKVRGVVVATPAGRGVVLADVVVDATGNADIAAAAGAPCLVTNGEFLAVQGTGLPPHALGATYTNTDYTFADESDMVDQWRLLVAAKKKFAGLFDMGQLIDTRERRRIVGEHTMTIADEINGRTYPDVIAMSKSNYDSHGYTVDDLFLISHPERKSITAYVPYRCLLPKGLNGMLVAGIGISVHRDALPIVRMQPDVQNVGYAAGCAAAMAAQSSGAVREIDLASLQKHLAELGCIPPEAPKFKDSYPLSDETVAQAVRDLGKSYQSAAVVQAAKDRAVPLMRKAYAKATDDKMRLLYARTLAVFGDATGSDTLLEFIRKADKWDKGWNFRGMGQYGRTMSDLDLCIVTLAMAGEKRAVAPIIEKLRMLTPESDFSHHRSVAMALEMLGDKTAAGPLAELLKQPKMTGYAVHNPIAGQGRSQPLREIVLARALFRLGDRDGLGRKILESYAHDVRGHYSRHATAVLEGK